MLFLQKTNFFMDFSALTTVNKGYFPSKQTARKAGFWRCHNFEFCIGLLYHRDQQHLIGGRFVGQVIGLLDGLNG